MVMSIVVAGPGVGNPHTVTDGITETVYVPGETVPQSMPMLLEEVVPFGVVKDAPAGNPLHV